MRIASFSLFALHETSIIFIIPLIYGNWFCPTQVKTKNRIYGQFEGLKIKIICKTTKTT